VMYKHMCGIVTSVGRVVVVPATIDTPVAMVRESLEGRCE